MIKLFTCCLFVCLCCVKSNANGETNKKNSQENITFYEVPLVCGAAPHIGCGSRAKPVFIDMEKEDQINEVWLNRTGTIIAVVWNQAESTKEQEQVAMGIFQLHNIDAVPVKRAKKKNKLLVEFRTEGKWYKGTNVDQLSLEEAGVIADWTVGMAMDANIINNQEAETIKTDIETYFKTELVKVRTFNQLKSNETRKSFYDNVYNIYKKYLNEAQMAELKKLHEKNEIGSKQVNKNCCKKEKKSCCSKKKL